MAVTAKFAQTLKFEGKELNSGTYGVEYDGDSVEPATGGSGDYIYNSDEIPAGLTMSSAGVISGTPKPAAAGNLTFKVTVTDNDSKHTATADYTITIAKASVENVGETASVNYSAKIGLSQIDGLFKVDPNARERTYSIEPGGTGEGEINGDSLTVTKPGTFEIGLETAETPTHQAGAKVTGTLTVEPGPTPPTPHPPPDPKPDPQPGPGPAPNPDPVPDPVPEPIDVPPGRDVNIELPDADVLINFPGGGSYVDDGKTITINVDGDENFAVVELPGGTTAINLPDGTTIDKETGAITPPPEGKLTVVITTSDGHAQAEVSVDVSGCIKVDPDGRTELFSPPGASDERVTITTKDEVTKIVLYEGWIVEGDEGGLINPNAVRPSLSASAAASPRFFFIHVGEGGAEVTPPQPGYTDPLPEDTVIRINGDGTITIMDSSVNPDDPQTLSGGGCNAMGAGIAGMAKMMILTSALWAMRRGKKRK